MMIVRRTLNKCITLLPRPRVVDKNTYPCERSVRVQLADPMIERHHWTDECGRDRSRCNRPCWESWVLDPNRVPQNPMIN